MNASLFQVSLLQALALGDYDGKVSLEELKRHGDIGVGTFDGLDGEMIMLDGVVYRAAGDGSVSEMGDDATTPFACVTFADDAIVEMISVMSLDDFVARMHPIIEREGINSAYFIKVYGTFTNMTVRSIGKQDPPYRRLVDVLSSEQVVWDQKGIAGTVVGLYCPSYMSKMNNHGWHLHFISSDRKYGGHILDLNVKGADCMLTKIDSLEVSISDTELFQSLDLSADQEKEIKRIESTL